VVPTLKVTTNDNNGNVATWTYVNGRHGVTRLVVPTQFLVTKTDPQGNLAVFTFSGGEYQTQADYYQGPATGQPIKTVLTCYNGNFTFCKGPLNVNGIPQPQLPIMQRDVYTYYNGVPNLIQTNMDSYGNVLQEITYDFGVNVGRSLFTDTVAGPLKQIQTIGKTYAPIIQGALQSSSAFATALGSYMQGMANYSSTTSAETAEDITTLAAAGASLSEFAPVAAASAPYIATAGSAAIAAVGLHSEIQGGLSGKCNW
jgi:hypothetical protein